MKKKSSVLQDDDFDLNDELLPEYDVASLKVIARGPARQRRKVTVEIEADVAAHFPDSQAVNEALRTLIRVAGPHSVARHKI